MTTSDFYNKRLDTLLNTFLGVPSGCIEKAVLLDNAPDDIPEALSFLSAEGYLEESEYCFKITYKGKALIEQGGFIRKHRRERALFYCTVVAAVSGVLGLLVSLAALLCQ